MQLEGLGDSALTMTINFGMSVGAFFLCLNIIPKFKDSFISANLFGVDLNKLIKKKV